MRLTRLHLILILVVLGAIGLFIAQNKKSTKSKDVAIETIPVTETQNLPQQIPEQPLIIEPQNKERIAREAIAVAGEYFIITKKSKKDIHKGQQTLHQAKTEYQSNNYETAILLAKQSITEFKSAPKLGVFYRVKKHDCLWKIAEMKRHYGKGWKWPKIWEANKKKIKIPQLIYPKQVFFIPDVKNGSN